jgi:hypothetical protein
LIAERFHLGAMDELDGPATAAMRNGTATEPEARRWYEFEHDCTVRQVGIMLSDDGRIGASPDGLVDEDGGVEIKCPAGKTHIGYLLDGGLPAEYKPQVHGCLVVSERKWWDFVSYKAGLPPLCVRVYPDAYTEQLRGALDELVVRLDDTFQRLGLQLPTQPEYDAEAEAVAMFTPPYKD